MVNCGLKTIKYTVFLVNFLIFIISVVIVASGAQYLSKLNPALMDSAQLFKSSQLSVVFLIVISSVALVISFLGCCGAVRESPCLLSSFASLILILLLAELVIAALLVHLVSSGDFEKQATDGLLQALHQRNETADYNAIDDIQIQLHCCGVISIDDYTDKTNLPYSCCPPTLEHDGHGSCSPKNAFTSPCMTVLREGAESAVYTVGVAALIVALIQVAAVVGACCLSRAFRREYDIV